MKRVFLATLATVFALCMQAQDTSMPTFTSPDGVLKVIIHTQNNEVKYTIYEGELKDGNIYALDNNIALNIEGAKEGRYTISSPKLVKEHFDAPNYKLSSFDSEYNTVTVKNKMASTLSSEPTTAVLHTDFSPHQQKKNGKC